MSDSPRVFVDPDGTGPPWMYVVVRRATGVRYEQQYGGTACQQGSVEGYLVPVWSAEARALLDELFLRELGGAGLWAGARVPSAGVLAAVRRAVELVPFWSSEGDATRRGFLRLDDERLAEVDEAWVPVVTPDGPGVLLWDNSD